VPGPTLPGATYTVWTLGDCTSFQASACSRPPEPTTRTFMPGSAEPPQGARSTPRGAASASERGGSCFHLGVVIDLLHVVQVLDDVEQLLHPLRIVAGEPDGVLGAHRHLGRAGLEPRLLERVLHRFE